MLTKKSVLGRRSLRWVGAAGLSLALGMSTAACGGLSDTSSSSSGSGTTAVTVGVSGANINILPVWVAQKLGYFTDAKLNVKLAVLNPSTTNSALASGSAQFLAGSAKNFLTAVEKKTGQVAVAQTSLGVPLGLIVGKKYAAAHGITKTTPLATVVKDLAGSTGGESDASTTQEVGLLFKEFGGDIKSVKVATLSTPAVYLTSLKTNQIDWFCTSEPTPLQSEAAGAGVVVAGPDNVDVWSPANIGPGNLTLTTQKYASSHASTVSAFAQAMQKAAAYIHDTSNADSVTAIASAQLPTVPKAVLKQAISQIDWPADAKMTAQEWAAGVKFTQEIGAVDSSVNVTEGTDWTNKYLG